MTKRIAGCALSVLLIFSATAFAQSDPKQPKQKDKTRWGVSVGFGPNWVVDERDKLGNLFFDPTGGDDNLPSGEGSQVNITGHEFRVGVARGRELGGDWEVSFLHRKIDDGSTVGKLETNCGTYQTGPNTSTNICTLQGTRNVYRGAAMMGLEVNKFFALATIKKRVQLGLNLGIGIAKFTGQADRTVDQGVVFQNFKPVIAPPVMSVVNASDLFNMSKVATGKFQFSVAGILPGSIKVRADIGYAFPGIIMFGITGNYLFGHR
jgi:hypothetical protein